VLRFCSVPDEERWVASALARLAEFKKSNLDVHRVDTVLLGFSEDVWEIEQSRLRIVFRQGDEFEE
jgi:hypothetical protein